MDREETDYDGNVMDLIIITNTFLLIDGLCFFSAGEKYLYIYHSNKCVRSPKTSYY